MPRASSPSPPPSSLFLFKTIARIVIRKLDLKDGYIYIGPSAYLSSYKEFIVWIGSEEGVERDVTETEEMSISVSLRLTDGKFDRF